MMMDHFYDNDDDWRHYNDTIEGYSFNDGIAKIALEIKLNPNITDTKRDFVANGVRSFFHDKTTVLYSKKEITDTLNSTSKIFNAFVAIIGAIALTIAFFLLLISTTQNVTDAIWEYGVLRSMGVTKSEGRRIFMYEVFVVVISAAFLGICVGLAAAMVISAQFYMFLELPMQVFVPWYLLAAMVTIALLTTYLSVVFPVSQVNGRQIASVLKAGA